MMQRQQRKQIKKKQQRKQRQKTLSVFMVVIFVIAGFLVSVTSKAAETDPPTISNVGVVNTPLLVGDTEKFTVTSKYEGKVQYRAFLYDGISWKEFTNGYTPAVNGKTPYVLPQTSPFKAGKYMLSVWVRRAGVKGVHSNTFGDYDNYYALNLNCVKASTVPQKIASVSVVHSPLYVGDTEKFTVTSKYDGQVQYRAFLYDGVTWKEFTNGYTAAVNGKTPYVLPQTSPFKAGKYMLSVWVRRAGVKGVQSNTNGDFDNYYALDLNCVKKPAQEIASVSVDHSPLYAGDTEKFTVTSKYDGQVQYRAFLYDGVTWKEFTNGYTTAVNGKTPYVLPQTSSFKAGKYMLSVWVRRAGVKGVQSNTNGDFDNYRALDLNCVNKPVSLVPQEITSVSVEHSPLVEGDTEKFTVTSKYDGQVQYRAFIYDGVTWKEFTKGYTTAVNGKTPYVLPATSPFKEGKYRLSVWVRRAGVKGVQSNTNGDFDNYYALYLNCLEPFRVISIQ
ncbi:hypothetical protein [Clostridium sp.]|uniref:hypothetical protein n=1 Tax=Clostridium sp. TaxID=1506 RepID=UPI001A4C3731|nr:hypothetical protein [Clostridium sp.]MBK5240797.1 hypothetical protein [Clostridium sp.]